MPAPAMTDPAMTDHAMTDHAMTDHARMTRLTTRDGSALQVRAACAEDETALAGFFDRVTDEDRRFRFLTAIRHLGHEQIEPLTHVDHWRTESFIAFDAASGEIVASAMLACDAWMETGEVAISVCGAWKGRGVGWAMLDLVAGEAQRRGLRRVISIEDRDNHAAIAVEREKGFVAHGVEGDPHLVMLERTLA